MFSFIIVVFDVAQHIFISCSSVDEIPINDNAVSELIRGPEEKPEEELWWDKARSKT
jgi:hypothetical protein